ncbi:MAG: SDR family NAD(P)-dependent oxidoreductase [Chitinophagaceae bacterium]|nr:MAG: SDR family NAD(P)-dependent oxidoreductase [Chitinophagaceae bacterium]
MEQQTQLESGARTEAKVWFITGASRGFGRIWTEAALERGDLVAATARSVESIKDLNGRYGDRVLTLALDVTNARQVQEAVTTAHRHFGRLDIVCNNAGYSLVGTVEEASLDEVRALYETNIIGAVSVIQAALPLLRAQGFGHILGTSSSLGHLTQPVIGYYCSSKWAFEAIHESLAAEVAQFGIKVTLLEPGAYATEFGSPQSLRLATSIEAYDAFKSAFVARLRGLQRGNPAATAAAVLQVADAANPPLRLFLGSACLPEVRNAYATRLAGWEEWAEVSNAAQG